MMFLSEGFGEFSTILKEQDMTPQRTKIAKDNSLKRECPEEVGR